MPQDFLTFASQNPREAALVQTVATQAAVKASSLPDLTTEQQQDVAEQMAIELLKQVYRKVPWFGRIPLLDALALQFLIPHVPGAVRGILDLISQTQE